MTAHHIKIVFDDNKEVFLTKLEFFFFGRQLDYVRLKNFLKYECELYLKQPLKLDSGW
jgi:hypothetical protein